VAEGEEEERCTGGFPGPMAVMSNAASAIYASGGHDGRSCVRRRLSLWQLRRVSIYLPTYPPTYLPTYLACLPACLPACLSAYLSTCAGERKRVLPMDGRVLRIVRERIYACITSFYRDSTQVLVVRRVVYSRFSSFPTTRDTAYKSLSRSERGRALALSLFLWFSLLFHRCRDRCRERERGGEGSMARFRAQTP
jgi:hypothetical protein